jgi:hypothetical protein
LCGELSQQRSLLPRVRPSILQSRLQTWRKLVLECSHRTLLLDLGHRLTVLQLSLGLSLTHEVLQQLRIGRALSGGLFRAL